MRTHPINDEEITSETNDIIENSSLTNNENNFSNEDNPFHLLESRWTFDTLAIDNGLWLAERLSTFITLRRLSLIDIKRSSFELIFNTSLFMFSVHFPIYYRAAYTFEDVPEGAYY
ncbi:unnamed protein product [Rotaria sp. Silwood1]|nr:unnamed protein product [Rotaria sp. Silwood1]